MAHENGLLFKEDLGITLKDLDANLGLNSYFLSSIGPTHLDQLLFSCLNLHTSEGTVTNLGIIKIMYRI